MSEAQRVVALRVFCQAPGCVARARVDLALLAAVEDRCQRATVDADGEVHATMLILPSQWALAVDPDGCLYAVCPVHSEECRLPSRPESEPPAESC